MKKRLAILVLALAATIGTTGCASNWLQNFLNSPVEQIQSFDLAAQEAVTLAQTAWATITPLLPPSVLVTAQATFTKAVVAAHAALSALNDAVQAAVDANNLSANFQPLMQAVSDAIVQIETIVQQFQNPSALVGSVPTTGPVAGVQELAQAVTVMKHIGHTK